MKKIAVIILVTLTYAFSFGQSLQKEAQHPDIAGKLFRNPAKGKSEIVGIPYAQKAFARAKVININVEAYMRYNVYADEFEFITPKNDTLILDKIDDFSKIHFIGLNKKYVLTPYTEDKMLAYGYLIDVYEKAGYGLLKKETISFTEAKVAKTTLETSMPARYTKQSDSYFFKNKEAGIVAFPEGKKALVKLFPDRKEAIETFVKTQKIAFDEEKDLIKIIDFIAAQ
jgi:hypothetical protein